MWSASLHGSMLSGQGAVRYPARRPRLAALGEMLSGLGRRERVTDSFDIDAEIVQLAPVHVEQRSHRQPLRPPGLHDTEAPDERAEGTGGKGSRRFHRRHFVLL